jgi:hypothetical protein
LLIAEEHLGFAGIGIEAEPGVRGPLETIAFLRLVGTNQPARAHSVSPGLKKGRATNCRLVCIHRKWLAASRKSNNSGTKVMPALFALPLLPIQPEAVRGRSIPSKYSILKGWEQGEELLLSG